MDNKRLDPNTSFDPSAGINIISVEVRTVQWVARRVIEKDLLAAEAGDDVVAEAGSLLT